MELKKVLMVSTAALGLAAAGSAQADDYFTIFGGASFQNDISGSQSFSATLTGLTHLIGVGSFYQFSTMAATFTQDLDSGFVLGAAYGRNFNKFWRGELEMAYREFQVGNSANVHETGAFGLLGGGVTSLDIYKWLTYTPSTHVTTATIPSFGLFGEYSPGSYNPNVQTEGSVSFFSIMANVWYDFNIADNWETFIGAGIGMAQANANAIRGHLVGPPGYHTRVIPGYLHFHPPYTHTGTDIPFTTTSYYPALLTDPVLNIDGTDWVFAYQFGVGAGYNLDNGVRLSAQFRYFGTDEANIDGLKLQGEATEVLFGISFPLGN